MNLKYCIPIYRDWICHDSDTTQSSESWSKKILVRCPFTKSKWEVRTIFFFFYSYANWIKFNIHLSNRESSVKLLYGSLQSSQSLTNHIEGGRLQLSPFVTKCKTIFFFCFIYTDIIITIKKCDVCFAQNNKEHILIYRFLLNIIYCNRLRLQRLHLYKKIFVLFSFLNMWGLCNRKGGNYREK